MNQPIENRIRKIEERLNKIEQQTEPVKVTRIEIDQGSQLRQQIGQIEREQKGTNLTLDNHTEMLKELSKQSDRHTQAFAKVSELLDVHTETISDLQADVKAIKATQIDHGEILRKHTKRFDRIEISMVELKSAQAEQGKRMDTTDSKLDLILKLLQPRFE
jgi:chromosome segregation ATPase